MTRPILPPNYNSNLEFDLAGGEWYAANTALIQKQLNTGISFKDIAQAEALNYINSYFANKEWQPTAEAHVQYVKDFVYGALFTRYEVEPDQVWEIPNVSLPDFADQAHLNQILAPGYRHDWNGLPPLNGGEFAGNAYLRGSAQLDDGDVTFLTKIGAQKFSGYSYRHHKDADVNTIFAEASSESIRWFALCPSQIGYAIPDKSQSLQPHFIRLEIPSTYRAFCEALTEMEDQLGTFTISDGLLPLHNPDAPEQNPYHFGSLHDAIHAARQLGHQIGKTLYVHNTATNEIPYATPDTNPNPIITAWDVVVSKLVTSKYQQEIERLAALDHVTGALEFRKFIAEIVNKNADEAQGETVLLAQMIQAFSAAAMNSISDWRALWTRLLFDNALYPFKATNRD